MIALLAALEEEASGLRRRMALAPERVAGFCDPVYTGWYGGHPVLLAWTGMGRERARAISEAVLTRYRVTAVISVGFSGALQGHLRVGDLVVATHLMAITGPDGSGTAPTPYQPGQEMLRAATQALSAASLPAVLGPVVTVSDIVPTPAAKQALGQRTGAIAVDMESYWVATVASAQGIEYLALRAISDTQAELLPPLHQILDADGHPRAHRLASFLIRERTSLGPLLKMAWNVRQARDALTRGVACTVTAL